MIVPEIRIVDADSDIQAQMVKRRLAGPEHVLTNLLLGHGSLTFKQGSFIHLASSD